MSSIRLSGDIDMVVRDELQARLEAAVATALQDGHLLVIDLGEVTFMDSTGLSCIALALCQLRERGGSLVLTRTPPRVRRVLDIAGLADLCDDSPAS